MTGIKILRPLALVAATLAATTAMAGVTFYESENFGGRSLTMDGTVPNFVDRGFNDRARSLIVEGSPVEVCVDINFSGGCTVLNPGQYPTLGNLGHEISSMRPVRNDQRSGYDRDDQRGGYDRGDRRSRGDPRDSNGRPASVTLFSGPNMTGRGLALFENGTSDMVNFNDRASSLRVTAGYWIFCSDTQFRGECRTFGPGEYPQLPAALDNRISSGRRISQNYPYTNNPNWEQRTPR